jgi:hypothetical protein
MMDLRNIADEVAKTLAYVKDSNGDRLVVTPLLYPSGSRVLIRIDQLEKGFFVSDYGCGANEASMLAGIEGLFRRTASQIAARSGIHFDSDLLFDTDVPREALVTSVISVANASKMAVEQTALKISEIGTVDRRETLWNRLEGAFNRTSVQRNVQVQGASSKWSFDAAVSKDGHKVLFEVVTTSAIAVNAAVTKFFDVRDLGQDAFGRIAVTIDREHTPNIAVLGRTATLLDIKASDEQFRRVA